MATKVRTPDSFHTPTTPLPSATDPLLSLLPSIVTAAKEKKAAVEAEASKKKAIEKEVKESAEWSVGAKGPGKKEAEAAKKAELAAKKAEAARLLAEEERNIAKSKPLIRPVKGDE
ncbi:hypothetical protein BC936DRAFT_147026, partial [Jimgerdemannia flammicorona]